MISHSNHYNGKIEFKDFIIFFITIALLTFFALQRFGYAKNMVNRDNAKKSIQKILYMENRHKNDYGNYTHLKDLGFLNPFLDGSVTFVVRHKNGLIIQAKESNSFDSFGDGIPGNEYFIYNSSGTIDYVKKQ